MMPSITEALNKAHLKVGSTIGSPKEIPVYGEPLVPSINLSTAYGFHSLEDLGAYHDDKFNSVRYSRDSSLLVRQLELYFSALHNEYKTLMFNSGMSALSAIFDTLVDKNSLICTVGSFYRKCFSIFDDLERKFEVKNKNYQTIERLIEDNPDSDSLVVFIESPSNPLLEIVDVKKVREHLPNARIVYDTTFQGLMNGVGLYQYADYIVMSCTKYIGGHNDVLGGVVACRNEQRYTELWEQRSMRGGIIDNLSAYFLLRSLRTYDLRMEKSLQNMKAILGFLEDAPRVKNIFYPGLYENSHQSGLFTRWFGHGGAVVTFRVADDVLLARNIQTLYSTKMAPSFGSVDSLIEIPRYMSHWGKPEEEVARLGIDSYTVRFSVGNEPVGYLIDDLNRLLE